MPRPDYSGRGDDRVSATEDSPRVAAPALRLGLASPADRTAVVRLRAECIRSSLLLARLALRALLARLAALTPWGEIGLGTHFLASFRGRAEEFNLLQTKSRGKSLVLLGKAVASPEHYSSCFMLYALLSLSSIFYKIV